MFALSKSAKSAQNTELDALGMFLDAFLDALDLDTVQISNRPKTPNSQIRQKIQIVQKHPKRDKASRKR